MTAELESLETIMCDTSHQEDYKVDGTITSSKPPETSQIFDDVQNLEMQTKNMF
jgi:hypothetical protein